MVNGDQEVVLCNFKNFVILTEMFCCSIGNHTHLVAIKGQMQCKATIVSKISHECTGIYFNSASITQTT